MATETKPLTAAKVRSELKKAGWKPAEKVLEATFPHKFVRWSGGFRVFTSEDGAVLVTHAPAATEGPDLVRAFRSDYRLTLRAVGIDAEPDIPRKCVVCRGWL